MSTAGSQFFFTLMQCSSQLALRLVLALGIGLLGAAPVVAAESPRTQTVASSADADLQEVVPEGESGREGDWNEALDISGRVLVTGLGAMGGSALGSTIGGTLGVGLFVGLLVLMPTNDAWSTLALGMLGGTGLLVLGTVVGGPIGAAAAGAIYDRDEAAVSAALISGAAGVVTTFAVGGAGVATMILAPGESGLLAGTVAAYGSPLIGQATTVVAYNVLYPAFRDSGYEE